MKVTPPPVPTPPVAPQTPKVAQTATVGPVHSASAIPPANSMLSLLNTLLESSQAVKLPHTQSPATSAVLSQLITWLKQWEKPLHANQSKSLLEQLLQFRPLNASANQSSPLLSPFNLLLSALISPQLSANAAQLLKQQQNIPQQLINELTQDAQLGKVVGESLKQLAGQAMNAQLASVSQQENNPPPIFLNVPLPINSNLHQVEAKIEQRPATHNTPPQWHLKMLLPVASDTRILADILLDHEQNTTIEFYCPDQVWLEKVNRYQSALKERLSELGMNKLTLGAQLGLVPQTLVPKQSRLLDITV
ncbi:hypothetical protein [Celerinatantimonas diazotrophica]|uniref:Flagellar hook-length control protein FliK n=1 Tax=Celerinatantimonas diazotrophica TaxID=412034 RepID=A0A4R1JM30_9GAMM|nr:hypothetical protein [Celerinatantimonas diazotrophica]TCK52106.1 hypothetical protein EV690_2214 [Celerinatantimonas diazotrophica]CAG9296189.1 hypothetical protein CEDIAZO_01332 [Celerinatantimonas diazotrophica]